MDELNGAEALTEAATLGAPTGRYRYAIRGGRLGVLAALARRMGHEMPYLEALVRAPRKAVARIAADTDLKPEMVRRCLELVANGAQASAGRQSQVAIALASGLTEWGRHQGQQRVRRLLTDRDFEPLMYELFGARRGIAVPWSRGRWGAPTDTSGDLINDAGQRLSPPAGYALQLAHLLAGAEAAVRSVVAEEIRPSGVMTADGWTSPTRLDVRRLKRTIQQRTGYLVGVAGKRWLGAQSEEY